MIDRAWQRVAAWMARKLHEAQNRCYARTRDLRLARWVGGCIIVSAIALVALGQYDGLLRGMHVPGRAAGGMSDLSGPLTQWGSAELVERSSEVVDTWQRHALEVGDTFGTALSIRNWFVAVDSLVFLPAYLLLLAILFSRGITRLRGDLGEGDDGGYASGVVKLVDGWWGAGLLTLFVSDLVENAAQYVVIETAWDREAAPMAFLYLLKIAATLKLFAVIGAILFLALLVFILAGRGLRAGIQREGFFRWRIEPLTRVRLQLVLLLAFTASILLPDQGWDVPRRWDLVSGTVAVLVTFLYAYFSWDIADRLIRLSDNPGDRRRLKPKSMVLLGLVLVAVGGLVLWLAPALPWGIAVPGMLLVVIGAGSRVVAWDEGGLRPGTRPQAEEESTEIQQRSTTLAHILAAGPLVALGLSLVRSSAGQLVYSSEGRMRMTILLVFGVVLPAAGFGLSILLRARTPGDSLRRTLLRAGVAALVVLACAAVIVDDLAWTVATALGAVGIVALFALVLSMIGGVVVWFAERTEPPAVFRVLSLRRTPVLSLILVWVVVAGHIDSRGFHNVRVVGVAKEGAVADGVTTIEVLDRWLENRGMPSYSAVRKSAARAREGRVPVTTTRTAVPMTFTAASGGGIRAAYWTSLVLDCLYDRRPSFETIDSCSSDAPYAAVEDKAHDLFALSGISGGSLGLVSFASHLVQKDLGIEEPEWVEQRLDEDFLSPTLGWELFVESARSLLRFDPPADRAAIMEKSWERAWQDVQGRDLLTRGLRETWDRTRAPLLMLNGTSVNDGCRFEASVLNAGPSDAVENCLALQPFERAQSPADADRAFGATLDLIDFLCSDQDIALSTAALLSARFPFVSPPGRLSPQCGEGDTTYIVDGGYFESSAASPLVELWHAVEPLIEFYDEQDHENRETGCIVPFFVQIDNGYEIPDVPPRDQDPGDLLSPPKAQRAARGAVLAGAKEAAAIAFRRPFTPGLVTVMQGGWPLWNRYQHIYPRAHPGVQAPLGWALSPAAREDLRAQLRSFDNLQAIGEVRDWSQGTVTCAPASNSPSYVPQSFPLTTTLDLSETWRVSDTTSMLSLFRNRDETSISIAFLPPILSSNQVADGLAQALQTQVGVPASPTPAELGGLTGRRATFTGCDDVQLNVEILPTHLVSATACSPDEYRRFPRHRSFAPSVGGGLRFNLDQDELGETFVLEYAGRPVVVTITTQSEGLLPAAESVAATVLSGLDG